MQKNSSAKCVRSWNLRETRGDSVAAAPPEAASSLAGAGFSIRTISPVATPNRSGSDRPPPWVAPNAGDRSEPAARSAIGAASRVTEDHGPRPFPTLHETGLAREVEIRPAAGRLARLRAQNQACNRLILIRMGGRPASDGECARDRMAWRRPGAGQYGMCRILDPRHQCGLAVAKDPRAACEAGCR